MQRLATRLLMLLLLTLPAFAQRTYVNITRAQYGSGSDWVDVTERVRSLVADSPRFQVTDQALGVYSQAPGNRTLRIDVTDNSGNSRQLSFGQNEYADLSVNGREYGERRAYGDRDRYGQDQDGRGYRQGDLRITSARYGSGTRSRDVTNLLNSRVQNGRLEMSVDSNTIGTDPAPNRNKTLIVHYTYNGREGQAAVRDGEMLRIPQRDFAGDRGYGQRDYGNQGSYSDNNRYSSSQTIVCEANGDNRKYCAADTRGGVRLVRQMSGASCRQGSTWGYDDRGVWVSNGCRAEFQVASGYASNRYGYGPSITIPSGTQLAVRTNEPIDSTQANSGQRFSGVTTEDVRDTAGNTVIPRGSDVQLVIRNSEASNLVLDVDSISVGGQQYAVSTGDLEKKGGTGIGANKRTATMVGGGALAGAVIGAIAGGGKGAAIGAAVGGAAGAGAQVLTRGKQVKVPAETILTFQLDSDLQLEASQANRY